MKRHIPAIALMCLFLTGCSRPDVNYSDLSPATTATVSNATVTVHLGSDMMASACWTIPKVKVDGNIVYVAGFRTLRERSREFVVRLPESMGPQTVKVVWIDPDGSQVLVPIKTQEAEQGAAPLPHAPQPGHSEGAR